MTQSLLFVPLHTEIYIYIQVRLYLCTEDYIYTGAQPGFRKGGGGGFERVRQLQATLTRIFIAFESDLNVLSKIETDFFWPKSEIQTVFSPKNR